MVDKVNHVVVEDEIDDDQLNSNGQEDNHQLLKLKKKLNVLYFLK